MSIIEKPEFEQVAMTIFNQLGGTGRLIAMVGGHTFLMDRANSNVSFKIKAKSPNKINYIKISLNGMDTYDIEFGYIRGMNYTVRTELEGVYAEDLIRLCEETTGLLFTL
jgi:hypothetical protein